MKPGLLAVLSALEPVGEALDYGAWRRLSDTHPKLAAAVASAVAGGAGPEDIRRYVVNRTGSTDLAGFVEQAARWLASRELD